MKPTAPPISDRHITRLLDALDGIGGLTRNALAERSGCSLMTVCRGEAALMRAGIVHRARERAGVAGRPVSVLRPALPVPVLLLQLTDSTASARLFRGTMRPDGIDSPAVTAGSPLHDVNENLRLLMQAIADSALPALIAADGGTGLLPGGITGIKPVILLPAPALLTARDILSRTLTEGLTACGLPVWMPPEADPNTDPVAVIEQGQAALYALEKRDFMRCVTSLMIISRAGCRLLLRQTPDSPWFTPSEAQPLCRALDGLLFDPAGPDGPGVRRLLSLFPPQAVLYADVPLGVLQDALPDGTRSVAADPSQAVCGAVLSVRRQTWDALAYPRVRIGR